MNGVNIMMITCPLCNHAIYTTEVVCDTDLYSSNDEGEHLVECDSCKKDFVICANWEVSFKAIRKEQSECFEDY